MKKIILGFTLVLTVIVVGCEENDDNKISQAQECLDKAKVSADAVDCAELIEGIDNPKANRIRCALSILENGLTQDDIVDAFTAMDNSTNEDPVVKLVTILGLGDVEAPAGVDAGDEAVAEEIKNTCYKSNSIGMKTISQLILFGTRAQVVADAAGGDTTDPADIADNIGDMDPEDAGEFANDVYTLYCTPTVSNKDVCDTLSAAGAGTDDNATVGAALQACLANNTCN